MKLIAWLQKFGWIGGLAIAALASAGAASLLFNLRPKPWPRSLVLLLLLLIAAFSFGWAVFWGVVGRTRRWSHRQCYIVPALSFILVGILLAAKGGFELFTFGVLWGPLVGAISRKLAYPELKFGGPPPEPPVQLHIT